jgi:crotonobetainyl-CoA:carnitine CoA-transferase CaiB-like acyl-CoA transferase
MAHPRALTLILRLVAWADFMTEDFTPGTMEAEGLGYEDLCGVDPDVILFSTSMLGRGGPHAQQPSFGGMPVPPSGTMGLTGWPDQRSTNPYGAYTDFMIPRFAVPALFAALDYRRRIGRGSTWIWPSWRCHCNS